MASGASVLTDLPSQALFKFPPGSEPFGAVPPAPSSGANVFEFAIPDHIWAAALDPKVPLTIAITYAVTVKLLNRYNTANNKKPWAIAKTAPFRAFVILHNVFLAVYSAWTFWGMLGGMRRAVVSPFGPHGLAATADSLCQLNGPAGYGAGAVYNESSGQWTSLFADVAVEAAGQPSRDVPGRLWNEGLAFYGWIFYLSKFYEVLDTFIILAKGKQSSTLQTYHHAGAMMCMWAGIRYMSAPIWMFVLYNSFIHSLMYTYYTVTAFNIRVPTPIKRTLTTMQITQFLIGASYAMLHSFVSYTVPVAVNSEAAATQAATSSSPEAAKTLAAGAFENLKQMIYGAAAKAVSPEAAAAIPADSEIVWVSQPCITTSAETFAIWLNVLYLAPLTYLFVMFFIRSYLRRSSTAVKGKPRRQSNVTMAEKAGWDAARDINREIYNNGSEEAVEASSSAKPSPKPRTRRSKN
ncbi:GNS1/SUR4 family-domain-containing protein [Plectosphaerella plurivora]|uniref:Elongation of fatty acids protein n=1 Tax=Plectosphaerella plurivora TaxID=936078 RepID=A0A9P8VI47_9PEZI|nr:GNS1/SUR4 family-domain-containing protein [Plectosphaerella plurivora]